MLKKIPLHTFLIAIYFPLSLWASNLGEISGQNTIRLFIFMLLMSAATLAFFLLVTRNVLSAGILTSFTLFIFSTYGLMHAFFKDAPSLSAIMGRHRFLILLILVAGALLAFAAKKLEKNLGVITLFTTLFAFYLLAIPVFQIVRFTIDSNAASASANASYSQVTETPDYSQNTPDIYYLILDAYDRADYLAEEFGFDNSAFLDFLRGNDFYIADCSRSNYAHTFLSLASTLNLNYIEEIIPAEDLSMTKLKDALVHSEARAFLTQRGYQTVAIENVHWDFSDADVFFEQKPHPVLHKNLFRPELTFINNSALILLKDFSPRFDDMLARLTASAVRDHYELQTYTVESIQKSISLTSPKFVFGHIEKPHGPYVFEPNGDFIEEDAFYRDKYHASINEAYSKIGYIKQVQYVNNRVEEIVGEILERSNGQAVIIIQGDHGIQEIEDLNARMAILYAVYLPGGDHSQFHPAITPVNTFRIIFYQMFGKDLDLLEDASYYSYRENKLDYFPVDETMSGCLVK